MADGAVTEFRKDGTTVGSIGTGSGDLNINGPAGHSGIRFQASSILPRYNGSDTDGTMDLGYDDGTDTHRWRNLYLSGGAYIGGTGAANKLDDYEEGNWSSVLRLGGNGGTDNVNSTSHAKYTKIGNVVHINVSISMLSSISGSGHLVITGLPFEAANSSQLSCRFNDNMNSSNVVAQATGSAIHFYTQSTSTTGSLSNFTNSGIHSSAAAKHVNVSGTYNTDA